MSFLTEVLAIFALFTVVCVAEDTVWLKAANVFKYDVATCSGLERKLQRRFDQTLTLAKACEEAIEPQLVESDPRFERREKIRNTGWNSHWAYGIIDLSGTWDRWVDDEEEAEEALDSMRWVLTDTERGRLDSARSIVGDVRAFLEFKDYFDNAELPTTCSESGFEKTKLLAKLDPKAPTIRTVLGHTGGDYSSAWTSGPEYVHFTSDESKDICEESPAILTNAGRYGLPRALVLCDRFFDAEQTKLLSDRDNKPIEDELGVEDFAAVNLLREFTHMGRLKEENGPPFSTDHFCKNTPLARHGRTFSGVSKFAPHEANILPPCGPRYRVLVQRSPSDVPPYHPGKNRQSGNRFARRASR